METKLYEKKLRINKAFSFFCMLMLVGLSGCSVHYKHTLPSDYDDFRQHSLYNTGKLFLLHVGQIRPKDSVIVFIDNKIAINTISTNFPYPTEFDTNHQGTPTLAWYDFIITKKNNTLTLTNLNDPKKTMLFHTKIKDTVDITLKNNYGYKKSLNISSQTSYFVEFEFFIRPDSSLYADTIHCIRYFD